MTDISVPGLATQTPQLTDSVPGVRSATGLLDCRFTLTAIRTLVQSNLAAVATSGAYADLSGKPSLAAVATTGAYSDLTGKPTLGSVAALSGPGGTVTFLRADNTYAAVTYASLTGAPSLATVATTGAYSDLTGKPTLGNVAALTYAGSGTQYLKSTGAFATVAYSEVSGTPTLATVATTGAYSDLTGKPTLGTVAALSYPGGTTNFLRADGTFAAPPGGGGAAWGSITGTLSSQTDLNTALGLKADSSSLATVATTGAYSDLSGKPTLGTLASQNGTFSGTSSGTNTGDQTTVSGNAGTATKLATARNINGVAFDGSANITVPSNVNVQAVTSSATVTPTFSNDAVKITAQAAALTLANPTGTAVDSWGMSIRIKDNGTARAISYGTQYRAIGVTLPTTTVVSKTLYLGMIYNSDDTKWDVVAVAQEA